MKVIGQNDAPPFEVAAFVEAPGSPSHNKFADNLYTVAQQQHYDIHIPLCPMSLVRDMEARLEARGYEVYARIITGTEAEFWLKRRSDVAMPKS